MEKRYYTKSKEELEEIRAELQAEREAMTEEEWLAEQLENERGFQRLMERLECEQKKYKRIRNPEKEEAFKKMQAIGVKLARRIEADLIIENNEEYDALGIDVSDSELSDYMFKYMLRQDQNFAQSLQYLLQATQAPVELKDPSKPEQLVQDFHAFIFNPAKFGRQEDEIIAQAKAWWLSNEQNAVEQLKQMKFGRLFGSMVAANDLDRAALNADMANSYTVRMVAVPYSSLDDKDYKVGEAEIKAVYEKEKERFALKNEVRRVHYIAVAISPSKADNEKADKFMEEVDSTLHATEGVEGIRHYSELTIAETEARDQDLARATIALKNFVDTAAVGQISPITRNGDDRIIYRLLAKKQAVDSVHITRATVMGNKAMQDSVIALLNGGKSLDELANDSTVSKLEENMPLDLIASVAQGVITEDMRSQMLSAGNDFFIQQSEDEGALICRVDSKSAPKTVYEAATITYTVTASKDTRNDLFSDLQKYVDANNTAKAFVENATKSSRNYSVMTVNIDETTPALGSQYNYVKSSSKMIQWLFKEAKEGQVSAIQGDNDQYLVAALDKVYDGDYLPLEDPDVKKYCETQARNEKKGDALVKKYAGKANDIDGYAKLLGKPVQTQRVGGGGVSAADAGREAEVLPRSARHALGLREHLRVWQSASNIGKQQGCRKQHHQFPLIDGISDIRYENSGAPKRRCLYFHVQNINFAVT